MAYILDDRGNIIINHINHKNKRRMSQTEETEEESRNKEVARATWDNWIVDLTDADQPEQCSIDNPDCENCGS
tara:strand:+ start:279 stop:497 length:219 start_codon:yes stop_codon:yes gene_type:complete